MRYLILVMGMLLLPGMSESASWNVETSLATYLKDHYPWAEVEISDLRLSAEQPKEEPSLITVEKTPPGNAAFRLDFLKHKSIHATAFVKVYDRVIMSRVACRKGYVLKPEDLYPTLMENGRIPKGAVREEEQIIGKPLLRSIVPNTPVIETMVSKTPLVKRGHKVVLCVESAGFSIKTLGEIKQDAAVGDYVKAVNLNSRRVITGLLEDENTVRVEF